MFRLKLIRNLRTALWLFCFALIPCSVLTLYWINKNGLPSSWRAAIEEEISKHGIHAEIGSLSYIPLRGFVASNVRVFAEKTRIHEISKLERIQLVLDHSNLAKGKFRLRKLELRNATLSILVDPKEPAGEALEFTEIHGTVLMPDQRLIEIRNTSGKIGGIHATLNARLFSKQNATDGSTDYKDDGERREIIALIIRELQKWKFDPEKPPKLQVEMEGRLKDKDTLKGRFTFQGESIGKNDYQLTNFHGEGHLASNLLTMTSISAEDAYGTITGNADYQIPNKEGRFSFESSIDVVRLLNAWFQTPVRNDLLIGGSQKMSFGGDFNLNNPSRPEIDLTGHAICKSVMFRGVTADSIETWFSWRENHLFLKDITISRPDGIVSGKLMKENNLLRFQLKSSVPLNLYKPFFKGKPLESVLAKFTETETTQRDVHIEGSFDTLDKSAWSVSGRTELANLSYHSVPLRSTTCSFMLNHHEFDFFNGTLDFDYTDYPLRTSFDGPASGTASIERIRYDRQTKLVNIENVRGVMWGAPMVRLFAPKIADHLEQYRFHAPHPIAGSGQVDVTRDGRTDLVVNFSSNTGASYKFLGKDITLGNPSAVVSIKHNTVEISDLVAQWFGGVIQGKLSRHADSRLTGDMTWNDLKLSGITGTYGTEMQGGGKITGRLEFNLNQGDVSTMTGEGLVALNDGELFSVPIFGPLSTIVSKVVNDKRMGHERAKEAFCTFTINNGILSTRDFQTQTSSVKFTGDGSVDLTKKTIDFTIRLNARGLLLSIITAPVRPFFGLFQFRGSGPMNKPVWENVHFTSPPEQQNQILLEIPRAIAVPESGNHQPR
ncbi:MAG: hypothetical protein RL346_1822 [Verrucomicrobiota bacterium]|jgi:hypothetical protein